MITGRRSVLNLWRVGVLLALVLALALPILAQEPVQVRATHNLHLRAAPSTASRIYATMPHGTVLTVTAISFNYRWLRVSYNGQAGWAARTYTEVVAGDIATLPLSDEMVPPAVTGGYVPAGEVIISPIADVNIRLEPDPEADLVVPFPAGEQASARAVTPGGLWVFVEYGAYRGWAMGQYIDVVSGSMAALPVVAPGQVFIDFRADRTFIPPGQCVQISWLVAGARGVYYKAQTVAPQGTRTECPTASTRYTLRVVTMDNQIISRDIDVIIGVAEVTFTVDRDTIQPGECVTLEWDVTGVQSVYLQDQPVNGQGFQRECPAQTATYTLRVVTLDNQTFTRDLTVTVGATGGTPAGLGIVFNADRTFISSGECVMLTWSVTGAASVTYQNETVTASGSRQECPTVTATYVLRVTTTQGTVEVRFVQVGVSG